MATGKDRIRIAYVNESDPWDKRSWSGTHYSMAKALSEHCGEVISIGPIQCKMQEYVRKLNSLSHKYLDKMYDYTHSLFLSKSYANFIEKKLSEYDFDLIFAPEASTEIAFLKTNIPIIYLSDVTFALFNNYNPGFLNLLGISVWEGNTIERLAIKRAKILLYPTQWAAESARRDYHADGSRIHVIPFGANLEDIPPAERILERAKPSECKLLFLATNWEGKGGEIAFETLVELETLGIKTQLVVCGCTPPSTFSHPRMTVIGFLDKNDRKQRDQLTELFFESHFLLLPTRSDCAPIAFCEANAFGLPVITTDTGGVPGIITEGKNGFMLPLRARGPEFARLIKRIWNDNDLYFGLVKSSRTAFDERLNWDAWGKLVKNLIAQELTT